MTPEARTDTRFLDLDHDGLLDAVESTECVVADLDLDGEPDIVSIVDELDTAIGDDGVPGRIETLSMLALRRPTRPQIT